MSRGQAAAIEALLRDGPLDLGELAVRRPEGHNGAQASSRHEEGGAARHTIEPYVAETERRDLVTRLGFADLLEPAASPR